jgi:L-fucose isomerase-like protein
MYEPFHSHDWGYAMVRAVQERFGLRWTHISSPSFLKRWEEWKNKEMDISDIKVSARRIYYLGYKQLIEAKRMYLLLKSLIEETKTDAFTINCLASIILSKLDITPCYALSRLNDEGIVSACEADTTTLLDMLITVYASDSPGFMVNPFLFPSDNRILLSHCTSPTLHSYKQKKGDKFNLYPYFDHPSEQAVALQILKGFETVTVTGISGDSLDKMLIIKGKIVKNTYFSTCRTQVEIKVNSEVKDIAKDYQGRHWIMVYGDHSKIIQKVNDTLGIESITYL